MRRTLSAVCAVGLLSFSLTACGSDDFCEVGNEAVADLDPNDIEGGTAVFQDLRDEAPEEIQDDFDVVLEQLELAGSDPASADLDALNTAAQNITAWEEENC